MKVPLHVTVDKPLVDWIDEHVDTQRFRNRSHAVTVALMELKKKETVKL